MEAPPGYSIVRQLGRGGMAVVYLVRADVGGEEFALKRVLPHSLGDPAACALFLREIENCLALKHDNIVRTFDSGVMDDDPFLLLEFCNGGSLDLLIKREGP